MKKLKNVKRKNRRRLQTSGGFQTVKKTYKTKVFVGLGHVAR